MKKPIAFVAFLLLLPSLASAQLDCIVPTREEGYEASRPGAEAIRRAARAIEAIVKRNALFMAGNEPVRVRTSISYHGNTWLSSSELPWVPVTIAEALDWREREIAGREASWQEQSGSAGKAEAQLRAAVENMKKVNPAAAEDLRVRMERDIAKMRADEARVHAKSNDAVAGTRAEFDAYRASFSAAQLREQSTISGAVYRKTVMRVDDPKGRPIVRVDAAAAERDPGRIKLLVIPQNSVATDEDHQWQVASRNALDYAALAALLEK
jgi:hypothetical protein